MAVRTVMQLGDPGLRAVARPVADPGSAEIRELIADLADTLAHWRASTGYGRGIAAPQIGVGARVIFLQLPGAEAWPLVNPEITWRSEEKIVVWDACLSFLSIFMQVERHQEIVPAKVPQAERCWRICRMVALRGRPAGVPRAAGIAKLPALASGPGFRRNLSQGISHSELAMPKTTKKSRHPAWAISIPPRSVPTAGPQAWPAEMRELARPRCDSEKWREMILLYEG